MGTDTLVHADGTSESISLSHLLTRAAYTLLYFYPKDDTPGCTLEAQEFTQLFSAFSKQHIQIVGVSKDHPESHCHFIQKYELAPSYVSDPALQLHQQFGARGTKNMYGKLVEGTIRSSVLLDTKGTVLHHRKSARAKGHAAQVLQRAQQHLS